MSVPCFQGRGDSQPESCCCRFVRGGQKPEPPQWLLQRTESGPSVPKAPRTAGYQAAQEGLCAPHQTTKRCMRPAFRMNMSVDI